MKISCTKLWIMLLCYLIVTIVMPSIIFTYVIFFYVYYMAAARRHPDAMQRNNIRLVSRCMHAISAILSSSYTHEPMTKSSFL